MFSPICKLKPPRGVNYQKDVAYPIPCKLCTACYIGDTGQKFGSRRYQHEYDIKTKKKKNGIGAHIKEDKKHQVDWDSRHQPAGRNKPQKTNEPSERAEMSDFWKQL